MTRPLFIKEANMSIIERFKNWLIEAEEYILEITCDEDSSYNYETTSFDFLNFYDEIQRRYKEIHELGYTFRARIIKKKTGITIYAVNHPDMYKLQ